MADEQRHPGREIDYRAARIGAAIALVLALIALLFLDAFIPDYNLSPVTLGFLLTTIGLLLGVEGISVLQGRDGDK